MSIAVHSPPQRQSRPSARSAPSLPSRLLVSASGGACEVEAERLAQTALKQPAPQAGKVRLQAGSASSGEAGPLDAVLSGGGRQLPQDVRDDLEPRFGHDFSRVRVHPDGLAARSAVLLGARAFTAGENVVLAGGQYAPHTPDGRRLLAHELAHVVQGRSGSPVPLIRPRLFVTGGAADILAFLGLLGTAGSFALKRDPTSGQVTGKHLATPPPSPTLADMLQTIMDDPDRDAEIALGGKDAAVSFGAYPSSLPENPPKGRAGLEQRVAIDQILTLEKGVKGYGASILAHEMFENYQAHDPELLKELRANPARQPNILEGSFFAAHEAALEKEGAVGADFGLKGKRQNTYHVMMGKEPRLTRRSIEDHELYFIVWDTPFGRPGPSVSKVRKVGRVRVSAYTIEHYKGRTGDVPAEAQKTLDQVAADMLKDPTASAGIEARMSVYDSPRGDPRDPKIMAARVKETLIDKLGAITSDTSADVWERFRSQSSFVSGDSSVVITLDRPEM
jgi:hypothetical protein